MTTKITFLYKNCLSGCVIQQMSKQGIHRKSHEQQGCFGPVVSGISQPRWFSNLPVNLKNRLKLPKQFEARPSHLEIGQQGYKYRTQTEVYCPCEFNSCYSVSSLCSNIKALNLVNNDCKLGNFLEYQKLLLKNASQMNKFF